MQTWFGQGYFMEDKEQASTNIFEKWEESLGPDFCSYCRMEKTCWLRFVVNSIEKKKLLSSVEQAGLLTALEKVGVLWSRNVSGLMRL